MVWNVKWDGGFVTGGEGNRRLTPNFRLKEFKAEAGSVRVHRELVSALQLLRNRFGQSLSIKGTDDDGLGVTLGCRSVPDLLRAADLVQAHHLFEEVKEDGTLVKVRIPDPSQLPEIDLEQVLETAFSVTSAFETSGDRFQQVTGNFDGAGLLDQIKYLQRLKPDVQIDHLRCICALYDLVIQQGSLNKAHDQIEERVQREDPQDQFKLVEIAVEERGKRANPRWVSDVLSRRLSILRGVPTTVDGRQRANINFYMLRDVRIRGARELMTADAGEQVAQVSHALATGDSLLA